MRTSKEINLVLKAKNEVDAVDYDLELAIKYLK